MIEPPDGQDAADGDRFVYFMVRLHGHVREGARTPTGIIERLGSGRKQPFSGPEELLRLLAEQQDTGTKMIPPPESCND